MTDDTERQAAAGSPAAKPEQPTAPIGRAPDGEPLEGMAAGSASDDAAARPGDADPSPSPTTGPARRRWVRWLWRIPAGLVILTALLILPFRWLPPPTTAFMLLYGGDEARDRWVWVDWEDISPQVAIAVVASEDQRFPEHRGLDLDAIREALSKDGGPQRGASTISQQVAKNLYLWAGRSWVRKGLEAYLTLWVEALWPKKRILEVYLNVAQFGPTTFGVGAAAPQFFGVAPSQLTATQASFLAVVLPSPRRMSPARPSAYMHGRAAWIREQVRMLGGTRYLDGLQ